MQNLRIILFILLGIIALVIVGAVVMRQTQDVPETGNVASTSFPLKGVSFSPLNHTPSGMNDFFTHAKEVGNTVTWAGDWLQLADSTSGPHAVAKLAQQNSLEPVIIATIYTTENNKTKLLRPLSTENQATYKQAAKDFAQKYQPKYMGLGIEINRLQRDLPADYGVFKSLFATTYADIKSVSPDTQVFTVFQFENLIGRWDGLFGGTRTAAQWQLLDDFPQADLIGLTTYPYLIYKSPADIPDTYYAEITSHTTKPLALTEIGWPSESIVTGWDSSQDEQRAFVERYKQLTASLHLNVQIWTFLFDQNLAVPFKGLGLLTLSGEPKPALAAWQ